MVLGKTVLDESGRVILEQGKVILQEGSVITRELLDRLLNWNIRVDLEQSYDRAEKLGIMKQAPRIKGSPAMCLPTDTTRVAAIAQGNSFFGDKLGEP